MSERITAITEYHGKPDGRAWGEEAGFQIVTDKQTITLAIDDEASCCESWGYLLTEDDPSKFVGAGLLGIRTTDTNRSTKRFFKGWSMEDGADYNNPDHISLDSGETMFVDIETDRGILQFVAYNAHNGYYGHQVRISSSQLELSEVL